MAQIGSNFVGAVLILHIDIKAVFFYVTNNLSTNQGVQTPCVPPNQGVQTPCVHKYFLFNFPILEILCLSE